MIISLRGTNGAGKSTIVRTLMERLGVHNREELRVDWRRKPLGYFYREAVTPGLFVPGHYEIANGGVDTIESLESAYELILAYASRGFNVIYEGKNMSDGPKWVRKIEPTQITLVHVELPVDECISAVRSRGHSIKEETIRKLHDKTTRDMETLEREGYRVYRGDRKSCLEFCAAALAIA